MNNRLTPEQLTRLREARLQQHEARERIESLATSSLMAWLTSVLAPIVRKTVSAVVGWFFNLFK